MKSSLTFLHLGFMRAHGKTLSLFTNRLQDLQKVVQELVQAYLQGNEKIRLAGVRVSNLKSNNGQRTLNNYLRTRYGSDLSFQEIDSGNDGFG